jgi:transcriptional regulator with XRE-family HTH domain
MQDNRISRFDRNLGRRLKQARQMRRMTQIQLGKTLGVSYQQLQKNESGVSRISAERLERICGALNLPLGFFLDMKHEGRSRWMFPAETLRLAAIINDLPSDIVRKNIKSLVYAINTAWRTKAEY